jgi:3-carboxy-cis,cis-muconate cycloisomerase
MSEELEAIARSLATLADQHRRSVAAGRTLGQWAVPISFGLKAAQWLIGVLDARDDITRVVSSLPVQCGGAAGTRALADQLSAGHADALAHAFADELQLTSPALPWHTRRRPLTSVGDAVVGTTDALGVVAADIVLLSRPEIAEVRECPVPGRGGSSTMPHKQNPVLSVLVCAAAQQAPLLAAQLHLAAATAVDERPPGAWHAEWPALARLLELGVTAASQGSELVAGLQVDGEAMAARARAAADQLLAERGGGDDPAEYLGRSEGFVDAALARFNDTAGMVTGRA